MIRICIGLWLYSPSLGHGFGHEHRIWYSRFLSITLTKAPCAFQEALNFIRLGALGWQDKNSPVWVSLASACHKDEAERVIQPGHVISSVMLLRRDSYCRVIVSGNVLGWCPLETFRSLLLSTYQEDLRMDLWLGWERGVCQCHDQQKLCEGLSRVLRNPDSTFMYHLHEWISLPALQDVS